MSERLALPVGCVALIVGVGLLAEAIAIDSLGLLIAAAALAGVGQGAAVGAGLQAINTRAPARRRGEAASAFFVVVPA